MKFMTSATVQNLPGYMNQQGKIEEVAQARAAQKAKQERQRELGFALLEWIGENGTSSDSIMGFAKAHKLTPEELVKDIVPATAVFKKKYMDKELQGPDGVKYGALIDEDNVNNRQIYGVTSVPKPELRETYSNGESLLSSVDAYSGIATPTKTRAGETVKTGPSFEDQLKLKSAGAPKVVNQIGEKSMTGLGVKMGEGLVEERKDAVGALQSLDNIKEAKALLDAGMITGTGAEFLTSFGNFLASRLGIDFAEDPVSNTQAYAAAMGKQVGQIIKQFGAGTGLSDADREYAEKIVGGKITLTEKALRKLIGINERAFTNLLSSYNEKAEQVMNKPGADQLPYDLRIKTKTSQKEKDVTNMSDEELLKALE